ncbi:MAG: HNH endonuclease [bacterium]|nr:HNH endonuclease [bacterium]
MNGKVLVLNQDYTPITVCSIYRAFLLVYLKKADLVDQAENQYLRTVSKKFPLPSVIKINRYVSIPYRGVVLTRHNIFKRDKNQCQYCGTTKNLTLDHVIPKSKGGKSTWTNLTTACQKCNAKKGDNSLEEVEMKLRNQPIKPSYVMFLRESNGEVQNEWLPYLNPKKSVS